MRNEKKKEKVDGCAEQNDISDNVHAQQNQWFLMHDRADDDLSR